MQVERVRQITLAVFLTQGIMSAILIILGIAMFLNN